MDVAGRTFLVTGGASGLGAACVRRLAGSSAAVVIADLDRVNGELLATELGDAVRFAQTDVNSEAEVSSTMQVAVDLSRGDGLRGVINCAGIAIAARVLGKEGPHPLDAFFRVISVDLIGTFNTIRLAAAVMEIAAPTPDGERGIIINTASVAAFEGQVGQAAYAASKGGVTAMTLPVARELARHGIRVVAIAPGLFDTPMMAAFPTKVRQSLEEQAIWPARLGRPQEFAALAQHIIENPMLNGNVIRLDGAVRLLPR